MILIPDMMMMESETVLTQYIISSWSLVYRNQGKLHMTVLTICQAQVQCQPSKARMDLFPFCRKSQKTNLNLQVSFLLLKQTKFVT